LIAAASVGRAQSEWACCRCCCRCRCRCLTPIIELRQWQDNNLLPTHWGHSRPACRWRRTSTRRRPARRRRRGQLISASSLPTRTTASCTLIIISCNLSSARCPESGPDTIDALSAGGLETRVRPARWHPRTIQKRTTTGALLIASGGAGAGGRRDRAQSRFAARNRPARSNSDYLFRDDTFCRGCSRPPSLATSDRRPAKQKGAHDDDDGRRRRIDPDGAHSSGGASLQCDGVAAH
jgi:hypothetical protein